jgi:hypothetical protein
MPLNGHMRAALPEFPIDVAALKRVSVDAGLLRRARRRMILNLALMTESGTRA